MAIYDVTGIGNAIVDVLAPCTDEFLSEYGIEKGAMTLIDEPRAKQLYEAQKHSTQISGGSAANTMAGIASFGGKGAYIGVVANDPLGDIFAHDAGDIGLTFNTPRHIGGEETARSFIFISPDGERSMNTYLGACTELSVEHIDRILISNSKITYMEGYLFDKDPAKEAFYKASEIAKEAGQLVSLSLSDSFCVQRHRSDFMDLVRGEVDILFSNEQELISLFETDNFDDAFDEASKLVSTIVGTQSDKGALIAHDKEKYNVPIYPVDQVKDMTGAGDQFAAGFLYGYTNGLDIVQSGKLAARAASEVISHIGPRPETNYKDFIEA